MGTDLVDYDILYFGDMSIGSTSSHRAAALRRLGHRVTLVDPWGLLPRSGKLLYWFNYRTGYKTLQHCLQDAMAPVLSGLRIQPSFIWVNSGELFGPSILRWLRSEYCCPVILYCNDDPTGPRDWNRFRSLRSSLPFYDLCICLRQVNELEWLALGARKVLRVWMSYDEVIHFAIKESVKPELGLGFIGTNIPAENRDQFIVNLLDAGIPVALFGARWSRSKHWNQLRPYWRDRPLANESYSAQLAKIAMCLGLLSHRNRDLHTRRTMEVPAAGGVLLAERSSEHRLLFEEGVESLYWKNATDCAELARHMLSSESWLAAIRTDGHQRLAEVGVGNEDVVRHALAVLV